MFILDVSCDKSCFEIIDEVHTISNEENCLDRHWNHYNSHRSPYYYITVVVAREKTIWSTKHVERHRKCQKWMESETTSLRLRSRVRSSPWRRRQTRGRGSCWATTLLNRTGKEQSELDRRMTEFKRKEARERERECGRMSGAKRLLNWLDLSLQLPFWVRYMESSLNSCPSLLWGEMWRCAIRM